jgi:23S rRNA (cytidine1920-2'-O)/16S rRNA (cytidine1409-2'-O)-methyltransferase
MIRKRADLFLVEKGLVPSREKAKELILDGKVLINGKIVKKPASLVDPKSTFKILKTIEYVSRGGTKLAKALEIFPISIKGKVVLDVGAGTGGFCDCLLQKGAHKVIAVDVGYGQIAWKIRTDKRVYLLERTNIRYLKPDDLPARADLATVDLSFISITKIIDNLIKLMKPQFEFIILIKPQFEAKRFLVKKGLVKDPAVHRDILSHLIDLFKRKGLKLKGLTYSPIKGAEGNIEFFVYLANWSTSLHDHQLIENVVTEAHTKLK